ncbi:MAG: FG-GAP repeat protein [Ignavibacteria bacterium]|nr:FG-GAP repeat protein [Ignavibacteria bacterium]
MIRKKREEFLFFKAPRTGLSKSPNWIAKGDQNGGAFGKSASMAGDVNGDGYSDVIIGAYGYNDKEGMVFVYYGSLTGLSKTANWSAEGNEEKSNFGSSVATAGDVNGDKFSDVIISAEDKVFVYYGSTNGLSKTPNWSSKGSKNNVYFGNCVSTAGDVNGDGFSDIIIGDFGYNNEEGMVFVYYGSPIGLSKTANWTAKGTK